MAGYIFMSDFWYMKYLLDYKKKYPVVRYKHLTLTLPYEIKNPV